MPALEPAILIAFQLLIAPGVAIVRGGGPERRMALAYLADTLVSASVMAFRVDRFLTPNLSLAAIDGVMLVIAAMIAIRANRWWPIWFTACHAVGLLAHASKVIAPGIAWQAYQTLAAYVAYPLWMIVLAGTLGHNLRLRTNGSDPDWKRSLPQSIRSEHHAGPLRY